MPRKRKLPEGIRERNGTYHADFYAGGRRIRKRLSRNLDVATQLLHELQARADRADFGLLDNDYALAELREQYLRHCKQALKPSTLARYTACLDQVMPRLAANRVAQITPDNVRSFREGRLAEGVCPRTVNMELTVLGTLLRWAVTEGKIGSNPLADFKVKPLRHDFPKEGRALTDDEVNRLLDRSPQPWRDIWYAYLTTGMRKSELASLTFRDVDWGSRELIVRGGVAKNHRERRIPVDAGLWEILCRQRDGREHRRPGTGQGPKRTQQIQARFSREHVFVNTKNTPLDQCSGMYSVFMRCCARTGIQTQTTDAAGRLVEHVDLHSLRRTFATNLIVGGADPETVRQLLGHKTLEMTMKIYTKIHNQTKRQALAKLSYGRGTLAPEHLVEYPGKAGFPVQNGHKLVTGNPAKKAT